jgi:DNA-binding response OmpR family regulator
MAKERILVVDDERELADIISDYLVRESYEVQVSYNGASALKTLRSFCPQLVILDVMLPDIDGMEICRTIRAENNIPIILLSARGSDVDKILGLGLGADDYISKPFSPGELIARVKAHFRRFMQLSTAVPRQEGILNIGNLEINEKAYTVKVEGRPVELAAKEFELLCFMASHPLQVFTRDQLFNQIWGYDEYGDVNTVTVHIRKIREKVEKSPSEPCYIKTVWGVGYKFDGGK